MGTTSIWLSCAALLPGLLLACGSDSDSGLGGGTGGSGNTSGSDGGGASGGASGSAGTASGGGAGEQCSGTHPLLDGGARYCEAGSCRCVGTDLCFAQENAARCCDAELVCFT